MPDKENVGERRRKRPGRQSVWSNVIRLDLGAARFRRGLGTGDTPDQVQRTEMVLATARCVLAVASFFAILLDSSEPAVYATVVYSLMLAYVAYSVLLFVFLRVRRKLTPAVVLAIHTGDVVWPAAITLFSQGPNSPFFLLFSFGLLAAGYRWGFRETLGTAAISSLTLLFQAFLILNPSLPPHPIAGQFEINRLVIRCTHLLITGVLLGILAEYEKLRRAESFAVARLVSGLRVERGINRTVQDLMGELLRIFHSGHGVLALEDVTSGGMYRFDFKLEPDGDVSIETSELTTGEASMYFPPQPVTVAYCERRDGEPPWAVQAQDIDGRQAATAALQPAELAARHECDAYVLARFTLPARWNSSLVLFDPDFSRSPRAELEFLQMLGARLGPALDNVYLLRRLRAQARDLERARLARELHDGAIQSLIGVEMQINSLHRFGRGESAELESELTRIQHILKEEVHNLRSMTQVLKPMDTGPRALLERLSEVVERFRRETGIGAAFLTHLDESPMPHRAAREVVRVLQEALANVRKHSGARNVLVRFGRRDGAYQIVVDDDGKGFPFSGRVEMHELEQRREGPLVLKERVRLLGGELTIESNPGAGARLEISIPIGANGSDE